MSYKTYETMLLERRGRVGIITVNKPEKLNSADYQFINEFHAAWQELVVDDEVRAILLKANGKHFGAGIDASIIPVGTNLREAVKFMEDMRSLYPLIEGTSKPTVAIVQGTAIALSVGLALFCDAIIASEDARFGLTMINFGSSCIPIARRVERVVGTKKAFEWIHSGEYISAQEYEKYGMLNKVVPLEKLEEAGMELAEKFASKAPLAMEASKRAFYMGLDLGIKDFEAFVGDLQGELLITEDSKEAIAAFKEKREPIFKGR